MTQGKDGDRIEQKLIIRREEKKDWEAVEGLTRKAFYNIYVPGCVEHYLVHIMREHEDFIPQLDLVLELDGHTWQYQDSPVMAISEEEAARYDDALPPMEKKHLPSQEEFYIISHSFLD